MRWGDQHPHRRRFRRYPAGPVNRRNPGWRRVFYDWDAEISLGYGRYEQNQVRRNELNLLDLTQALNAETGPFFPGVGDVDSGRAGNYDGLYDIRGRYGYLGFTVTF